MNSKPTKGEEIEFIMGLNDAGGVKRGSNCILNKLIFNNGVYVKGVFCVIK